MFDLNFFFFFSDFMTFCDEEWSELQRHVPTRWLTLIKAVERLLKHFASVRSYFLSKPKVRPYLTKFFQHPLAEAYLGFILNVGSVLQNAIIVLEKEETSAINTYVIMSECLESLESKLDANFFGQIAASCLLKCDDAGLVTRFKREACAYLELSIAYLKKNYHFDSKFELLNNMKLLSLPEFDQFKEIVLKFPVSKALVMFVLLFYISFQNIILD